MFKNPIAVLSHHTFDVMFGAIAMNQRSAWVSGRPFALQSMLGFGVAACIVSQHVAMPPRQPCTTVATPSGIAGSTS
jgi:hypothetical protein